jgi:excisionase family DNA binding protein
MQEVLTIGVREAAAMLGVSPWSIRRWVRLGRLPAVKLGRRTVLELAALHRFIATNRTGGVQDVYDLSPHGA